MTQTLLFLIFGLLLVSSFLYGKSRAASLIGPGKPKVHSRPQYHGFYVAIWCGLPALMLYLLWTIAEPFFLHSIVLESVPEAVAGRSADEISVVYTEIENIASGAISTEPSPGMQRAADLYNSLKLKSFYSLCAVFLSISVFGFWYARQRIAASLRARHMVEHVFTAFLFLSSTIAILTTAGIIFSLIFESIRFFSIVSPMEFLFGTKWSPQVAMRSDQVASEGAFGAVPLFLGTGLIALIAMLVAVPVGLLAAMYLSEYAGPKVRGVAKPLLEILAGIPTVVYGFFAALTVAPFFVGLGEAVGLSVSAESALAAGVVMGIMIIPFVSSLSDDVINAVPQTLRDGSYAMGATKSETIKKVIFPAALPGIVGAILLAISRAIGETMIVVMAAGLAANLTVNPLENVTTVTVQIVVTLIGDQEFDSPKTLSAFALGLTLFCVTLVLNVIALKIVKRYREKYD